MRAGVARNAAALLLALSRCDRRAADAAFSGVPFDEEGCEGSAKARYETANARLFAKMSCPACLQSNAPAVRDQLESALDQMNGQAYCAGTVPLP